MAAGDEVAEGDAFDFHRHEGVAEQEGCADYHVEPGLTFNRYEFGEYPHGNRRKEVEGEPADAVADGELDAPEGVGTSRTLRATVIARPRRENHMP